MAASLAVCAAGCSSIDIPWSDSTSYSSSARLDPASPLSNSYVSSQAVPARRIRLAITPLDSPPTAPLTVRTIGTGYSDALRSRLAGYPRLEVFVDPTLGREVTDAITLPPSQRARRLWQIWRANPSVDWVLTGAVNTCEHKAQSPNDLAAWGPSRNRMQATVEVKLTVLELSSGRTITTGQFSAVSWASDTPASQTYRGMTFGSHQFWPTPLGLASRETLDRAADQVKAAMPSGQTNVPPIRIVDAIDSRRVRLTSAAREHASPGDVLYICTFATDGVSLRPVIDSLTQRPLMARIEARSLGQTPSAWLMGQKPDAVDLRGAVLTRQRPDDRGTLALAGGTASSR